MNEVESIMYRALIAHGNHNNTPLIDRAVEKCRMAVIATVRQSIWEADEKVSAIVGKHPGMAFLRKAV